MKFSEDVYIKAEAELKKRRDNADGSYTNGGWVSRENRVHCNREYERVISRL